VNRLAHLTVLALISVALAGCAGEPPGLGAASTNVSTEAIASGTAFSDPATGAASKDESINPFADPSATAQGGREVIAEPSVADIMQPGTLPEMALGRADAPVTIVQYASLTCPHCRHFHLETFPELKRTYIDTGKVRYVLREFPIGKQSGNATVALRCAKPGKYFDLYGRFMKEQASWVSQEVRLDPIFAIAKQVGMTRAEFDACLQNQGMIDALKWVKERGRKLGIIGTPNFFLAGKLIKTELTIADIKAAVEQRPSAPAAAAAGVAAR
jgi:protein-disulfide isomerase